MIFTFGQVHEALVVTSLRMQHACCAMRRAARKLRELFEPRVQLHYFGLDKTYATVTCTVSSHQAGI